MSHGANSFPELKPPARVLLGPGPSNVHPRVLKAMLSPVLGHLDPEFLKLMDNVKKLLRLVFRTGNEITFPISGTGSAGMEAAMANLIEDGDEVVVGVAGVFGGRMAEIGERLGAKVHKVEAEWGRIIEPEQVEAALKSAARRSWSRSCTRKPPPESISRSRKSPGWRIGTERCS